MDIVTLAHVYSMSVAQAPEGGAGSPFGMSPFFMIALFGIVMYFLMMRPQQKRDAERKLMLEKMQKGDEVVTIGGICGTVVGLSDKHVVLRVDDHTKIEFVRNAISEVTKSESDD